MPETLLTVDEAAQRLKMKPATLRSQLRAGRIASVRTGKLWRIPESALEPQPAPNEGVSMYKRPSAPPPDEMVSLFAPPTLEDIARRLDALETLISTAPTRAANAPELDLSGDRGEVYGYAEREDRQL